MKQRMRQKVIVTWLFIISCSSLLSGMVAKAATKVKESNAKASYVTIPGGTYKINAKVKSTMMLDIAGNCTKNGTNIQIYTENESTAQKFTIQHVGSGWHKICHVTSGKSIDVENATRKSGVNVQLYDTNGTDAQLWRFYPTDQGYYYIQNKLGYYLDVNGGSTYNGANVQVYSPNKTNAQKWKPVKIVVPTSININTKSFTLNSMGAVKKLTASVAPSNATEKNVTWTSSDNKVVSVSNGTVKAVGSGTATITAKTTNGKTASAKVTVDDGCVKVKNGFYCFNTKVDSNYALDVNANSTLNGTNIQIYQKNKSSAQKFYIESVGNGWYIISNAFPRRCLDVQNGSGKSGVNVQLYKYNGSDAQLWRFYRAENGYYTVCNKLGYYLDVAGGIAGNNTNVWVYKSNQTNAQKWRLVQTESEYINVADSLYFLNTKVGNNMVLDVSGNDTRDGANIQIYQKNSSIAQKFKIQRMADGWYKISNPYSGKCLDVQGGSAAKGTNVQLYRYNGTPAQKWRFCLSGDGTYLVIKNQLGHYLDVAGGVAKNNTNVIVYEKNGTPAQEWKLSETSAIVLNSSSFSLNGVGSTTNITVSFEPTDVYAANHTVIWSSSNTRVATISNGIVKAVGPGTAVITARAFNGETVSATVTVAVKEKAWSVSNNILVVNGISMYEYKIGSKYTTSRYASVNGRSVDMFGWQCCGYARYIQQKLYGCHEKNVPSRFRNVSGIVTSKNLTAAKIQLIVNAAGVGGHIRTNNYNNTNQHSMIIIGISPSGFTIADANSDGRYSVRIKTFSWTEYVSVYGKRGLEYVNKYVG